MLTTLELRHFVLADEVTLEPGPGLNVLSGETGAGKSMLIDALGLLAGGRPDVAWIRSGEQSALVQGTFATGEVTTAARRLASHGRHTARLDGEIVTVAELGAFGARRLAIFGQHAAQALAAPQAHREQLDRLLSTSANSALARYREALSAHQETLGRIEALTSAERERARQLDILRFQIDEIDGAEVDSATDAGIGARLTALRHAERISQGASQAASLLSEGEASATELMAEALRSLEGAGRYHATPEALAGELRELNDAAQAISRELVGFLDAFEADRDELDQLEARQALLDGLRRKYGDDLVGVLAFRARAADELATLERADDELDEAIRRRGELEAEMTELGAAVTEARRRAAKRLGRGVLGHLQRLGIPHASFAVDVRPYGGFGPHGLDRVGFLFSANLGEAPAPLQTLASGGELSRVMLALNLVTGSDVPTLVFDEVDAGIGGATARSVGELLRRLADDHQVLVVTHLAQVAAYADTQFVVTKVEEGGRTRTEVRRLSGDERELELARMLSGSSGEAARLNARELLDEVARGAEGSAGD